MTRQELNQLYYLKKDIKYTKNKIQELEDRATKITANLSLASVKGGANSKDAIYAQLIDLKNCLEKKVKEREDLRLDLLKYIESIEDAQIRYIFKYRYINHYSWRKIAFKIGGGNTADSVRKRHERYLKNFNKNN